MSKHAPGDLRNVVLVGHGDAGKTTLAEHLLLAMGATTRLGSVADRTSTFDFEADEKERQHTLDCTIAHGMAKGIDLNLIDTPGYPDFYGEVITGVAAGDLALVCVSAHAGVMLGSRRGAAAADARHRAKAIVVTKCDLAGKRIGPVFDAIRAAFGSRCLPYHGPPEVGDFRQEWTDAAVEADDALMERYLDGQPITPAELTRASRQAVARGSIIPVVFTSTATQLGIQTVLDMIVELGPSPLDVPRRLVPKDHPDAEPQIIRPDPTAPFIGTVFKVQIDRHVGKLVFVRMLTGTLKPGDTLHNLQAGRKEKVGHLYRPMGRDHQAVDSAGPGDLVILTKTDSLKLGDTVAAHAGDRIAMAGRYPRPMYAVAIHPRAKTDEVKMTEALHKIADESSTFLVHREPSTGELLAAGLSPLHVDVVLKRLKDRYGIEVDTTRPKVPYKEAVSHSADGQYRHKKQSGGRGQFAEVHLRIEPGTPGSGLEFVWAVVGGSIPRNFEAAIEKGVREVMARGVIAGCPVDGVRVSVTEGKYHDVDSSDAAFKTAGGRAFRDAFAKARPVILEPIMTLEVTVPGECLGDISGDLNTRRARIRGMDQAGDMQVIQADIPLAEAREYARAVTSMTSGRGSYTLEPARYELVPPAVQQQIVAAHKPHPEDED